MNLDIVSFWALVLAGLSVLAGLVAFGAVSLRERESRAAVVAFLLAAPAALPFFLAALLPTPFRVGGLATLALATMGLWLIPVGASRENHGRPSRRVDERDIMFARKALKPGSAEFETYYSMRPENRTRDDRWRARPGFLSDDAPMADPVVFAAARASFTVCRSLRNAVDGRVAQIDGERPAPEMTEFVKSFLLRLGARDAGVAELMSHHVYTHIGRGTGTWGEPVRLEHRWAIAFTVEMDHGAMRYAPAAPVLAESARQYADSAKMAVELAALIRDLGYPARAHIDGNYRVIAPLVARDAGLGEIGRMGILMTPKLGPRVRLGVVTTNLPLVPDAPGDDPSVIDFCAICKKCAECCPAKSIPTGDRTPIDDALRWSIDSDSCFYYWNTIGTDCGRCMAVCPYSHPDNAAHNLVRALIAKSGVGRRAALHLDNLFYSSRPRPAKWGQVT